MTKLINKKVTATLEASVPLEKNLSQDDAGFSLNIGALTLSLDGRNFILDSTETNYKNPMKKGKKFTFETELQVDLEVFEKDEQYNYELTLEDLKNKNLKAEFYCSDCDAATEDAFNLDSIKINLTVNVDGEKIKINNVELE
jgi:hypothetical protein